MEARGLPSATTALATVARTSPWKSTVVALVLFVLAVGIALAEMTAVGDLLHALFPAKHVDIYYTLHQKLVILSLIAVSALWILALHPWAKSLLEPAERDVLAPHAEPAADVSSRKVTVLSLHQARDQAARQRGVAGGWRMR